MSEDVSAILEERGKRYGSFVGHSYISQAIKQNMKTGPSWGGMPPDMKEALEMIAHKIGRICNGDPAYADSWVDIAGYAKLISDKLV